MCWLCYCHMFVMFLWCVGQWFGDVFVIWSVMLLAMCFFLHRLFQYSCECLQFWFEAFCWETVLANAVTVLQRYASDTSSSKILAHIYDLGGENENIEGLTGIPSPKVWINCWRSPWGGSTGLDLQYSFCCFYENRKRREPSMTTNPNLSIGWWWFRLIFRTSQFPNCYLF